MSIGVWAPQGTVISTANGKAAGQPNVLYEANSIILHAGSPSTKVFKLWCSTAAGGGINYFESDDGISWTAYGSNPIIPDANNSYMRIYKTGGTYYIYVNLHAGVAATPIAVYTATDGVTFTLQNATALAPATQAWEGANIYPSGVIDIIAGIWYMAYASGPVGANQNYPMGMATSTDGINWTKYASNPIFDDGRISANGQFFKVGSKYYMYSQGITQGLPLYGATNGLPTDIVRLSAGVPAGPWTILSTPVAYRTQASEGVGIADGELGDPCLVEALGNVYMYNTAKIHGDSAGGAVINLQLASSTTIAQLVTTYEGMLNIPIPGTGGFELNLVTAASDNFNRANANPIGGNWSPLLTAQPAQIVSNAVEGTIAGSFSDSYYNAVTWAADQWGTVSVPILTGTSFVGVSLRQASGGVTDTDYKFDLSGTIGSTGTIRITQRLAGVSTQLLPTTTTPGNFSTNDTITGCIIGNTLSIFWNRYLMGVVSSSAISSGGAGFLIGPVTAVGNAAIDNWSGGTFQAAPPIPSGGSAGSMMMMGCGT